MASKGRRPDERSTLVGHPALDGREEIRKRALDAFLEERIAAGYRVETHTETHAIIVPVQGRWSFLDRVRARPTRERQVISVDEHGKVTTSPAEPLRS